MRGATLGREVALHALGEQAHQDMHQDMHGKMSGALPFLASGFLLRVPAQLCDELWWWCGSETKHTLSSPELLRIMVLPRRQWEP